MRGPVSQLDGHGQREVIEMKAWILKIVAGLRSYLGLTDSVDGPMTPPHGWLLPAPAPVRPAVVVARRSAQGTRR